MGQVLVGWLGLLDVLQTSLIQTIGRRKWKRGNGEKSEARIPKSERRPNSEIRIRQIVAAEVTRRTVARAYQEIRLVTSAATIFRHGLSPGGGGEPAIAIGR